MSYRTDLSSWQCTTRTAIPTIEIMVHLKVYLPISRRYQGFYWWCYEIRDSKLVSLVLCDVEVLTRPHQRQEPFCVDRKTYAKLSAFVKYVIKFVGRANPITNFEFVEEYMK
jgi:hypothetical protein